MRVKNNTAAIYEFKAKDKRFQIFPRHEADVPEDFVNDRTFRIALSSGALTEVSAETEEPEIPAEEPVPEEEPKDEEAPAEEQPKRKTSKK